MRCFLSSAWRAWSPGNRTHRADDRRANIRIVENLRLIASEDISEDEREHDHRQKRLKKCPEHTENRVPVLELNVLANDLGEKETVLIKILEVFLHPDHLHFFI